MKSHIAGSLPNKRRRIFALVGSNLSCKFLFKITETEDKYMKMKKLIYKTILLISFLVFLNTTVFSEGDDDDSETGNEDYRVGKELAYDGNYKAATVYLKKSIRDDPNNPDAFNMLGFSHRKLGNNDEAYTYYNKALELDPEHLGTHEYIGRLYLSLNQPEKAKGHLRILKALCYFGCEEIKTLTLAIEKYESGEITKKY